MKLNTIILAALVLVIMQACSDSKARSKSQKITEKIPVKVIELSKTDVRPVIHTSGSFSTDDETQLSFKTGGVIERIFVKAGDAVRQGQLLATLNLTEINAQVAQAELAYEKAKRDHARVSNLYRDSVATLEQFQNVKTGLDVAQRQLEAAKFNRSFSEIRAISNGYVLQKMANVGQVVSGGTTVFITNGAREGKWLIKVGVSDREWASIRLGDKGTVTTDALRGNVIAATVTRKSETTDAATGSFVIELTLNEKVASLASNMFGKVTINASNVQQLWRIPYEALLDGDAKSGYVFITNDGQKAVKVPVAVAGLDKDHVLIAGGLENAKSLIVTGSAYLRDGSSIQVIR